MIKSKGRALWVIFILLFIFMFASQVQASPTSFPDAVGHWAEDEIEYLENLGIISGLPDGTFGVNEQITRAQAAKLIANQQGLADQPAAFPDVSSGHWANGAIGAVAAAGIMGGYPDGDFKPNDPLTRAEAAVILANTFQLSVTAQSPTFPDVGINHWAFNAVEGMSSEYIATGYPDGTFKPGNNVTRAEFSVFVARVLNPPFTTQIELLAKTQMVIQLLQDENMSALQAYIHPVDGVRFSPYNYVEQSHLVFNAADIPNLLSDVNTYNWGIEDGTGDPIIMTPQDYFDRYVNRKDFTNPDEIQYNTIVPRGSMINNIDTFYPNGVFVEYHVEGTAQYSGMDWGSLYIVFENYQGDWYVVGIVNGEWTT